MVRAFPDETDSRVQARLQRLAAEVDRKSEIKRLGRDADRRLSRDAQAPAEPQQVASVEVEVTSVSLGAGQPSQPTQAVEEPSEYLADVTSQIVDEIIVEAVDKVFSSDDGDVGGRPQQEQEGQGEAADALPSPASLED